MQQNARGEIIRWMFRQIVIGWDGTDQARDAVALARRLRAADGKAVALCVVPDAGPGRGADWTDSVRSEALLKAEEALAALDLDWLEASAVASGSAAQGIDAFAEGIAADLIVVGSSHHGKLGQVLAGSVGQRLLHGAPCTVATAPKGFREAPERARIVGVAYDGSIDSARALVEARRYAEAQDARLEIITAVPPLDVWATDSLYRPNHTPEEIGEYRRAEFARMLDDAAAPLTEELEATTMLVEGRAADAIVHQTRRGIDLLFMGSRAYGPLRRAIAGSTAGEVMRLAACPVVVVPRGTAVSAGARTAESAAP